MEEEELFDLFVIEDYEFEPYYEFDKKYEFDAPSFYDFTHTESHWDAVEAESWFEFAASHPPSPFAIKLKLRMDMMRSNQNSNSKCNRQNSPDDIRDNNETQDSLGDGTKVRLKSPSRFRSSTLMKPTASHLAKKIQCRQQGRREAHSNRVMRRHQKLQHKKDVEKSPVTDSLATKRQKLEAGYLRKVAQLKHQTLFSHKPPKKTVDSNSRVTIPKEPNLETAQRALRRRSKQDMSVDEQTKSEVRTFKARPLNRKIFHAPMLASNKKKAPHLPDFQVFQLRTAERAMHHASINSANIGNCLSTPQVITADSRREDTSMEEKNEDVHKLKTRLNKMEYVPDKRILSSPLADSFSKLSLACNTNTRSHTKVLPPAKGFKENKPSSFHLENEEMVKPINEKLKKVGAKQYHCGSGGKIHDICSALNLNRYQQTSHVFAVFNIKHFSWLTTNFNCRSAVDIR
ncbi:hypothetical protein ACFE04_004535 [Oxalis oulophora]